MIFTGGPDDDSELDSLVLNDNNGNNVTFSPEFNPNNVVYTASVVNSITTITPVVTHDNGATTDVGTSNLTEGGDTIISITVTAQDGLSTKEYTITVTRAPSSDATLSALTLLDSDNQNILIGTFSSNTTSYNISVPHSVQQINPSPVTSNTNATINITGHTNELTEGGDTTIELTVTAQDGVTTKVYTIIVTRAPSSDATLSALTLSDSDNQNISIGTFSSNTTSYNISVPHSVQQITPSPVTSNTNATVNITGHTNELTEGGDTTIELTITAQDGITTEIYTLIIISRGLMTIQSWIH